MAPLGSTNCTEARKIVWVWIAGCNAAGSAEIVNFVEPAEGIVALAGVTVSQFDPTRYATCVVTASVVEPGSLSCTDPDSELPKKTSAVVLSVGVTGALAAVTLNTTVTSNGRFGGGSVNSTLP